MGFGRGGSYKGHSHIYFLDLILSFTKLHCSDIIAKNISNELIIVPPKTYLGTVTCGDFFFIKFCPNPQTVIFPEKINDALTEGTIIHSSKDFEQSYPMYINANCEKQNVFIHLHEGVLRLTIGNNKYQIRA